MLKITQHSKVFFAIGPGDVVSSYRHWIGGGKTPGETSRTFSSECFEFIHGVGCHAYFLSTHPDRQSILDGQFRLENRPKLTLTYSTGLWFHLKELHYAISVLRTVITHRPDAVVVDSGTTHWFMLAPLRVLGCSVVANFHNVYYPVTAPPAGYRRYLARLDGWFFKNVTDFAIGVSPECGRQFSEIAGIVRPFQTYFAQFDPMDFASLKPPTHPHAQSVFHILFVGRIEENKGVFDLLQIASELLELKAPRFVLDVCGDGGALKRLSELVKVRCLESVFRIHGRLLRTDLLAVYAQSHLLIAPTRSTFREGLPLVCIEAALAGRPVVTSRLSNALDILGDVISEAKADDVSNYTEKVLDLMTNPAHYNLRQRAADQATRRFVDPNQGLAACLKRVFRFG
jgi:glycogen synthase